MVEKGKGGAIVMISSNIGKKALGGFSVYGCAKAALDQLTRSLAVELGPNQVNTIRKTNVLS